MILYSSDDTPQSIKIELKNASGQIVFTTVQPMVDSVRRKKYG